MASVAVCCRRVCKTGWLPTLHLARHGSKSVTRHWKPMHIMRLKLMAVTEYIPPKPAIPESCIKPSITYVEEENGFIRLLRRQVEDVFLENRMIVVCQYNHIPGNDMILLRYKLRKHNIHAKFFPNEIMQPFLLKSKYKNLLPLFVGRNVLLVSPETKAKEMLRIMKTAPQINILGACVDNAILSLKGFTDYAKLPPMVTAQGNVVGSLSLVTSQTSTLLQRGTIHLTSLLDSYVKQQSGGTVEAKDGDS